MTIRNINGIDIDVQRKDIKNIHIHIKDGPKVIITAPRRCSDAVIDDLVKKRFDWITQTMERKCMTKQHLIDGQSIELIGKGFQLNIVPSKKMSITIEDGVINVGRPESIDEESMMREIHRELLKKVLPNIIERIESYTGLSCSSWQIRHMTSRWGTCNTKTKKIWLSTNIAKRPIECIEYVVLHELVHTVVPNHGPDFKALLNKYMPDWKRRKELLNS